LSITPEYLRNAASESGDVVDYRDWQVPLGRRFRALKLWTVLHTHGLDGLRAHIRGHVALAGELADRVVAEPGLALAAPPSLALVCLRVETGDPAADERATRALLAAVNATGRAFVTHTVVDGRYVIRVAVGGVTTSRADVDALWALLRSTAAELRAGGAAAGNGAGTSAAAAGGTPVERVPTTVPSAGSARPATRPGT
jgi:aromatic-L-amino-acid decarboxylase